MVGADGEGRREQHRRGDAVGGTVRYGTVIPPKEKVVRMVCLRWIYDEMRFCSIFIKPIASVARQPLPRPWLQFHPRHLRGGGGGADRPSSVSCVVLSDLFWKSHATLCDYARGFAEVAWDAGLGSRWSCVDLVVVC